MMFRSFTFHLQEARACLTRIRTKASRWTFASLDVVCKSDRSTRRSMRRKYLGVSDQFRYPRRIAMTSSRMDKISLCIVPSVGLNGVFVALGSERQHEAHESNLPIQKASVSNGNGSTSNVSSFRSRPLACRFERDRRTSTKARENQLPWDGRSLAESDDRHQTVKISDQSHACNLRGRETRICRNASHRLVRRRHTISPAHEDRVRREENRRNREIATGCRA